MNYSTRRELVGKTLMVGIAAGLGAPSVAAQANLSDPVRETLPDGTVAVTAESLHPTGENVTRDNAVVILVDFLTGLMPMVKTLEQETLANNGLAFAKIGQAFKMPLLILGDEGGFRGKHLPAMKELVKNEQFIGRHTPSAWREPKFVQAVQETKRKKLIIGGITTDNCVALLTLDALRAGYDVHVVLDAGGSESKIAEEAAISRLSRAGAVMTTWVQLASELMQDWNTPEGKLVSAIYELHQGGPKAGA